MPRASCTARSPVRRPPKTLLCSSRAARLEKPHNPLVNAGALVTVSFLLTLIRRDLTLPDKFEFVKSFLKVIVRVA